MFDVQGFILVGGQSSRMGSDKTRLLFGAQTGVERIAATIRTLTSDVRLVGSRHQSYPDDLANIPDTYASWGALGGIQAALAACRTDWAIIAACDLPFISAGLFARLWQFTGSSEEPTIHATIEAIVPIQPDGRPQPLCGVYRRDRCLAVATELIANGEHKPRALLAEVKTRWVGFGELSDLPGAEDFFLNVNTPDDYERARQIMAGRLV